MTRAARSVSKLLAVIIAVSFGASAVAGTQEYSLVIAEEIVNLTGKPLRKITVNGAIPGPTLTFTEGDEAVIRVVNRLDEDTSVHWHGLLLPGEMDGVPGFNGFPGIRPGEIFTYRFRVRQAGTYWYHAHSAGQEQDGHYGSIVIHPAGEDHVKTDRDYVVVLSDFHEDDSKTIMRNLKKSSEYYAYTRRTVGDFFGDVREKGFAAAWRNARTWGEMRMMPTDLADVGNYTFLINGKTPGQNWTGLFDPGERVRLRFINASAMSFYDVRIPGLKMTVVSADGQPVEPVVVDEFRFGVAETYDVVVAPEREKAYTIVAEPIDRTGFGLATLAPRAGMVGETPAPRRRTLLTMADMGMAHGDHGGHGGGETNHDKHAEHKTGHGEHRGDKMDHSAHGGHDGHGETNHDKHAGHKTGHGEHYGDKMNHSAHGDRAGHKTGHGEHHGDKMDHSAHGGHAGHKMHGAHEPATDAPVEDFDTGVPGSGWADADVPHGHKALAYKDLRYHGVQKDQRRPGREITVRLGGNMERYIWTLNGEKFEDSGPIDLEYGERVRLTFVNDTMMAHPMHLHGMFVQLENGQPIAKLPNKHVVVVAPGDTYSALLTADEPGEWAFHCHLLYHMMAGMMNKVVVARLGPDKTADLPNARKTTKLGERHNAHPGTRH